jgi:glycosyltransferase involved in cell wall biosynthesis
VSKRELTAIIPIAKMAGKLFNLESLLRKCHSLGIEVVIVHDEQDSDTGVDLETIVKSVNSDLVSVITKTVYSPGIARNLGISCATGDWICFWDSDDNPVPENFLLMVHQAKSQGYEIAVGKFRRINRDVVEIYGTSETEVGRMPGVWRFAFKRESIQSLTFPVYRMGEDQVFLARVDMPYESIFRFEEIVYGYVCGDVGQLTKNRKAILELEYAIKDMLSLISLSRIKHRIHLIFLSRQILTVLKHGDLKIGRAHV